MGNIENFKKSLDTDNDWILKEKELEYIWIELEWLENEALNSKLWELAPNYKKEIDKLSNKEKIDVLILFSYAKDVLWKDFHNEFFKKEWKYADVPLEEMTNFISEILLNEKNKELLKTKEIILTYDELSDLYKAFESKNKEKELKDFFNEQLNENTTSAEIIKWTNFAKKIESLWENPIEFIKNIDNVWFNYLQTRLPNASKDTLRNMATWITFSFMRIFTEQKWKLPELLKDIKNPTNLLSSIRTKEGFTFLNNTNLLIKEIKKIDNEEQNSILMDSQKFSVFYYEVITWKKSEEDIKTELKDNQGKYKKNNTNTAELKKIADWASDYITKENLSVAWSVAWLWSMLANFKNELKWFKNNVKDKVLEHSEDIFELKKFLESVWFFEYIKEFLDKILEFLGFDNGWEGFKNEVVSEKFSDIVKYLEKNITLEKIKDNDKSIFYKAFKENLIWDKKIEKLKVNWSLSYDSFAFLSSKWWNNIEENLNTFFTEKNFNKLFETDDEKKEFYKKAFKVEEQEVKDSKKKINIWIINFNMIDKIISKLQEKQDKNKDMTLKKYETASAGVVLTSIEWEEKKRIEQFISKQEVIVSNEVKSIYWINDFSYTKYINAIWTRESNWNYSIKNSIWALWKYQFMPNTLEDYKNIICQKNSNCNKEEIFLNSPMIQEQVMVAYTLDHIKQINWKVPIKNYKDLVYYLAKTHLWWIWNVAKNKSDTYGTSQVAYANDVLDYYSA